jgi:hypothetical protein
LNLVPRVKFNNYTTNQELDKKKNETQCWAGISEADFIIENNLIYEMGEHLQS